MLNYKIIGDGNPIVLLHGYLENMKMWEDYAEELSKDYQVIIVDLPGHGESETFDEIHTMELLAGQVNQTLGFLGISEALIVGHSMGGYVTLALADFYFERVKGFILMNSSSLADTEEKKDLRQRTLGMVDESQETIVKMSIPRLFNEKNLDRLKEEREFAKKMALETPLKGVKSAIRGMKARPDRTYVLDEFRGEIGIILGKFDRAIPPEEFKKVIPKKDNISVLELDTGHMAYLEAPKETLEFIHGMARKVFLTY